MKINGPKKFIKSSKIKIIQKFQKNRAEKHPETTQNTWKTHFRPSEPSLNIIQDPPKSANFLKDEAFH